jgi:hypothetical protein
MKDHTRDCFWSWDYGEKNLPSFSAVIALLFISFAWSYIHWYSKSFPIIGIPDKGIWIKIDSTWHRLGGNQQIVIQKGNKTVLIPLELAVCIVHLLHRFPIPDEIESLKQ